MFTKLFYLSMLLAHTLTAIEARAQQGSISASMVDQGASIGRSAASVGEFGHNDIEGDNTDAEMRHMKRRQQVFSDTRRIENNKRPLDLLPKANALRIQGR